MKGNTISLTPISLELIKQDTGKTINLIEQTQSKGKLFIIKSANSWIEDAKNRPIPNMLFSEFWHEYEICILFADTNQGKSLLGVQIANSISKGKAIKGFKMESTKQLVLYFDFELSDKQFEKNYSNNYKNHYVFHENLKRIEINMDAELPKNKAFDDFLYESFELAIIETQAKILIVDNITYLKEETEKAKDALPLMKHLKSLKKRFGLSILILAHTPKRDLSKPMTRNDIQGSKMLVNFVDSAFAIGESFKDPDIKYFKQIKQRNTSQIYNSENVAVCRIAKEDNFLEFEFIDFGTESEHLRYLSEDEKVKIESQIILMHQEHAHLSYRAIAKELGVNHMKVKRVLDKNK